MADMSEQIDYMIESKDRLIQTLESENERLKAQVAELTPPTYRELLAASDDKTKRIERFTFSRGWWASRLDAGAWQSCCDAYGPDVLAHGHRIVDVTPEPEMVRLPSVFDRRIVGAESAVYAVRGTKHGGWDWEDEGGTWRPLTVVADEHGRLTVACEPEWAES